MFLQRKPDSEWAALAATPARTRGDYTLVGAYRLLGTLFVLALAAALLWPEHPVVNRFAPNAATEFMGIIVTLVFVHRLLYRQERARRMRASVGAYRRANWALTRLVRIWADVVKGCRREGEVPRMLPKLFSQDMIESVASFDIQKPVDDDEITWGTKLRTELNDAVAQLNRIILAYGGVLDPTYTESVDELIDHPFLRLVDDLTHDGSTAKQWHARMRAQRAHTQDFFHHLLVTIALHNVLSAEAATVRSSGRSPRSGTLGVQLERDSDLRIETELSSAWRSAQPVPGSLCRTL